MLGQSVMVGLSSQDFKNRVFTYEVTGLRQTPETDATAYPIRSSSSVFIRVPYHRMNVEMRRISMLGGKIVGIHSAAVEDSESDGN